MHHLLSVLEQKRPLIVCGSHSTKTMLLSQLAQELKTGVLHVVDPNFSISSSRAEFGLPRLTAHLRMHDLEVQRSRWILHHHLTSFDEGERLLQYGEDGFGLLIGLQGWSVVETLNSLFGAKNLGERWMRLRPFGVDVHGKPFAVKIYPIELHLESDGFFVGTSGLSSRCQYQSAHC